MAHNEAPTPRLNVKQLVLNPENLTAETASGSIVASGGKLYFHTGAEWQIVTSA